ncbi:two-component system sensor histidine kinase NtrB [Bacillus suaedaesalsae]|uniref:histidine kinase n=1 Tax=Bacillus suaedaesalsae TaxID=2810349 RepID=A0ABS2DLB7_9BACI|nr:HAMP domain-containing sensor histidine kinase [Bacillus suaedaesalsae]MBM6619281.1 HAMP domain-containing histidine kinase [Bacillus suaedaesalsae]
MNLANNDVSIENPVFLELSNELRWIIHFNGYVVETNEHVKKILNGPETFYSTISRLHQADAYRFVSSLASKNVGEQVILHESTSNITIPVKYRAKLVDNYIFLNGTILLQQEVSSEKEEVQLIEKFISNHIDLAVLHLTPTYNIKYCNKKFCEILHISNEPIKYKDKPLASLSINPILSKLIELLSHAKEKEESLESYYYEEENLFHIQAQYFPTTKNILFVLHDRSYQQRFENLLIYKRQMETVSQLSAGVAHELRNPLSVIKGFIQLSSITNEWTKYYGTVLSEINRMNDIIDDFLSVSRKKGKRNNTLPQEVLESLTFLIRSECLLHNISLEVSIEKIDECVSINEAMIKQVLLNLLRNSIDAFESQEENRNFKLIGYKEDHSYVIQVVDTGPGMSTEIVNQLGKPFFTTKEKGNGIGIPLCRKIIEDHGGVMKIDSKEGEGTRFQFTLPLVTT